jgi:leader peptidase (prepilin peptidase)/N-methyltransferase
MMIITGYSALSATICGAFLALPIFFLYRIIVLYLGEKPHDIFKSLFSQGWFTPLSFIGIPSIIIANILLFEFGYSFKLFIAAIYAYSLLLLAAIDFKTQMLPDIITKPLVALGLVQGYLGIFTDIQSSLIGAFAGYFILWSVNTCFRMVRGIDGMGYGDFKLLSAIGAWTGIKMIPLTILFSSIIGIFVAIIILKTTKQDMHAPTPFGPSLVLTGFIAFLYGNDILNWYLNMLQVH